MKARQPGLAVVIALLVLLVVEVAVAGILFVATEERLIARAHSRVLSARLAARSATSAVMSHWERGALDSLPHGVLVLVPLATADGAILDATHSALIERLPGDLWLVRSLGMNAGATAIDAVLLRTMPADSFWLQFAAPLTTAGDVIVGAGAVIDGANAHSSAAPLLAQHCTGASASMARVLGAGARPALAARPVRR
jgi:hypothetical protein